MANNAGDREQTLRPERLNRKERDDGDGDGESLLRGHEEDRLEVWFIQAKQLAGCEVHGQVDHVNGHTRKD